jgi:hypothetical protein
VLTRQREFLQWIIGGVSTSAFIVAGVWVSDHPKTVLEAMTNAVTGSASETAASRSPASSKLEILEKHADVSNSPANKASGNMNLTLTSAAGRQSDGSLVLEAKITATLDLAELKYEWVLPDSVLLTAGVQHGDLGDLADGASTALEVTLNVPAQADQRVHLHVYREIAGEKLGQVVQYNTISQPSINSALSVTREALKAESDRKPTSVQDHDTRRME